MKYLDLFAACGCILLGLACTQDAASPEEHFTVSGVVSQNGRPVHEADVVINQNAQLTARTDMTGAFAITNVPKGSHNLTIHKSLGSDSSDGFVERSYEISVSADLFLQDLRLPEPVVLYPPEFTTDGIELSWSVSEAEDFREYKVYRHTSSGLDESTGTLIHVATERADTTFHESGHLAAGDYFYRVFVMNDFGRLGGSNIEKITLQPTKLLITVSYQGQETVNAVYRLFAGVYDNPSYPDFQDDGVLSENNGSVEVTIPSDPEDADNTLGPFYIASFLDVSGEHQGASELPSGAPAVIYDGINPFDTTASLQPTPVLVDRYQTKEIKVTFGDDYRAP